MIKSGKEWQGLLMFILPTLFLLPLSMGSMNLMKPILSKYQSFEKTINPTKPAIKIELSSTDSVTTGLMV